MPRTLKLKTQTPPGAGFSAANPIFPSVALMGEQLGYTNQFILVNEIAVRELSDRAQESENGVESYMKEVTSRRGIRVSVAEFNNVSKNSGRWYALLIFTEVDRLFHTLIKDIKRYKVPSTWIAQKDDRNLAPLEQLALNQPTSARHLSSYAEFNVLEYYRLVRNSIVHLPRGNGRSLDEAYAKFGDEARAYLAKSYQTRGAPNTAEQVSFDDFFLHTRVARDFSLAISDTYLLTLDEIIAVVADDSPLLRRARKTGGGSAQGFERAMHDYYLQTHVRWHDQAAKEHAAQFAIEATKRLR